MWGKSEVSLSKSAKGTSKSYTAADMCGEPASTDGCVRVIAFLSSPPAALCPALLPSVIAATANIATTADISNTPTR